MQKPLFLTIFFCSILPGAVSQADEIAIAGYEYKNVLITKTSSFFYVQLPEEGRTLSIPVNEVDTSSVKINNDPFYRTPLKEKYDVNRKRRAEGEIQDVDPSFRAAGNAVSSPDAAFGGGTAGGNGGGAKGLGVARTQVEAALSGFGFQVEAGPSSAMAKHPSGSTIELQGPPESLTGLVAKMSGPVATVDQGAQQMQMFVMTLNPGAAGAFTQALTEAKANGSASKSAGGMNINIRRQVNGENADAEIRVSAS